MEPRFPTQRSASCKPRALRYALLVSLAAAALCWSAPWRASARQQPKNSTVSFVLEVSESSEVDQSGSAVDLEVRNELDETEPTRKLSVSFVRNWGGVPAEDATILQGGGQLNLGAGGRVLVYPSTRDDKKEEHVAGMTHVMVFGDVSWPGAEEARLSATQETSQAVVYVVSLPLPPSKYAITADVKRDAAAGEPERVVSVSKELAAGRKYVVPVKARSTFERLLERFGNRESLLITIIVGLVGLVAAVLKDKIKEAANWVLDGLGRFGSGKLAERRFRRKYLTVVAGRHKHLRLVGFSSTGVSRPLLEEVFVSLRISAHGQPALGGNGGQGAGAAAASIPFAAALAQYPKMVILGAPGAGKTTTLSYALLTFAGGRQKERFGVGQQLLPVFVPLRRLTGGGRSIVEDLADAATQILPNDLLKDLPKRYFENRLERGECLVLLDGLDEVVDERTYREVADKINDLASTYPKNRFIVTCRIAGWRSYLSGDFTVLQTQDFSRDEIQKFVLGWHRAVITQSEYSRLYFDKPDRKEFERAWARHYEEKVKPAIEIKSRNLLNQIDSNNRILSIAVNPMLLSLTCLVHSYRNILPRGRTILYSQCLELLIDSWERSKDIAWHQPDRTTPNQKEAVLREIAFDFQARGKGEDTRANIEALVADISKRLGIAVPASELLEEIELRSGLLIERSIGVFGFSHLTLQEYLVAKHIQLNARYAPLLHENIDKQEWREVLLLYAGLLDDATPLVSMILERSTAGELPALALAGRCIGDSQNCDAGVSDRVIQRLLRQLSRGGEFREEVIEALAALAVDFEGDPKTPREVVVEALIMLADGNPVDPYDPLPDERLRGDCLAILGRAKATAGLETIAELLFDEDPKIQDAAARSLVSFGNLALERLAGAFERVWDMAAAHDERYDVSNGRPSSGGEAVEEENPYFTQTLYNYIEVLRRINTGGSAKLLLELYDVPHPAVRISTSLALARMLNNPFIEADLQQMRKESLPAELRHVDDDHNAWPRKNLPPGSGFPQLETYIIRVLAGNLGKISAETPGRQPDREELPAIPFKLMFPALLTRIKRVADVGVNDPLSKVSIPDEFWRELGFGERADTARLNLLATQIRKGYSTSLSDALQNVDTADADSDDTFTEGRMRFTVWASNFYFTTFMILSFTFVLFTAYYLYGRWREPAVEDRSAIIISTFLFLLSYLSVVVVTQLKLSRRLLSRNTLGTLAFPIHNLLKVFRNSVTSRRTIKFIGLQLVMCSLNYLLIFAIASLLTKVKVPSGGILVIVMLQAGLAVLCAMYLKFYLLASNPTLQLLLAHPEGAKLVKKS